MFSPLSLSLPPPAPHRWTYKLLQEDIVFCNRLEHSHLHFPWCRGGDWQRERKIHQTPSSPLSPHQHLPPAASATTTPPQAEQALGTSLAPKTQLRHEGKERPVWQVALAPSADAGASEWQGRGSSADHLGAASPGTSSPPQAQGQSYLLLPLERILPLGPSCRLLVFLHTHPHLPLPYQIAWASFINARLLEGGGESPSGIC